MGSLRQQHRELFKLATAQPVLPKSITAGFNLARFQTILNLAFLPPNLRPLHEQIDAFDAMEIMGSEGIPLSPVPRADIALELLEAGRITVDSDARLTLHKRGRRKQGGSETV